MQQSYKLEAIEAPEKFFANFYHVYYGLAKEYIKEIPFYPGESVLELGCRNGKVTEMLARLNTDVQFTAVTTTPQFLDCIQNDASLMQLPNVKFEQQLLNDYVTNKQFDKVISFICLNWIQDKEAIFKKIFQALKPAKRAYIQLFVDHGQNWFDQCFFEVAKTPQWQNYFKNFKKKCDPVKPGFLLAQAENIGFVIEKAALQRRKIPIISEDYFKNWMMTWSSHLSFLPADKAEDFFAQAVEYYLKFHPKDKFGQIYYEDFFFEITLLKAA